MRINSVVCSVFVCLWAESFFHFWPLFLPVHSNVRDSVASHFIKWLRTNLKIVPSCVVLSLDKIKKLEKIMDSSRE